MRYEAGRVLGGGAGETYEGVELGAVVLVVVGAVHGPVSHGDDPGTGCPVLRPVGLLEHRGARAER